MSLKIQSGLVLLCVILLTTTETLFLRSRPHLKPDHDPTYRPTLYRVRTPGFGRLRTRFLQTEGLSADSEDVGKRSIFQDQGVVFPWNEWKCQVRGCRKRG